MDNIPEYEANQQYVYSMVLSAFQFVWGSMVYLLLGSFNMAVLKAAMLH